MQSEEPGDHSFGVGPDVGVVVFEDGSEEFVLFVSDGFEHELSVGCVVEEGSALSLTGEGGH